MCRSMRTAQPRFRALSRIAGAVAPKTTPEPHPRGALAAVEPRQAAGAGQGGLPWQIC
jgi:hypothetical protein